MAKLATEYQGFLKFISRANKNIVTWFGPFCNYDPCRITFMAAREWDGMADQERKYFIKAQHLDSRDGEKRAPSGTNAFLCYLLQQRYNNKPSFHVSNESSSKSQFARLQKIAEDWRRLHKEEREKYASIRLSDLGSDHVISKRNKLHEMYEPKELAILEFILKTIPKKPLSSRSWFLSMENLSIRSSIAKEKWKSIDEEEKRFYEECSKLDKKRFNFEKSAWITNLLSVELDNNDFTLSDFESQRAKSNVLTLSSIFELKKSINSTSIRNKRPLSSFSIFLKHYRVQTRHVKSGFKFGEYLRDSAIAWAKLEDKERQAYKDASIKLRELCKVNKFINDESDLQSDPYEISVALYNHAKSITGPTRPSHLLLHVPSVENIYGKANNVRRVDRKRLWESLPDSEKKLYYEEHERLKSSKNSEWNKIKTKLGSIKVLIEKAKELEKIKKELLLLKTRKRPIKDLKL